jgi:hypothetical protein
MTNPFGEIDTSATVLHEMFQSYLRAGFNRYEALELVKIMVIEQTKQAVQKAMDNLDKE